MGVYAQTGGWVGAVQAHVRHARGAGQQQQQHAIRQAIEQQHSCKGIGGWAPVIEASIKDTAHAELCMLRRPGLLPAYMP